MNPTIQKMFRQRMKQTEGMIETQEGRALALQTELTDTNNFLAELRQQRDDLLQFARENQITLAEGA